MRCDAKAFLDVKNLADTAVVLAHAFERGQTEVFVDQAQIDAGLERMPNMWLRVFDDWWLNLCAHPVNQSSQGASRKPGVDVNGSVGQIRVKWVRVSRPVLLRQGSPKPTQDTPLAYRLYLADLHLEVRKRLNIGMLRSKFPNDETTYHRPSDFINAHRPKPKL